jgi:hypothetical protein
MFSRKTLLLVQIKMLQLQPALLACTLEFKQSSKSQRGETISSLHIEKRELLRDNPFDENQKGFALSSLF